MIRLSDFHAHTNFCDGKSTPREMVESAVKKGLCAFGLSSHAPMTLESNWSMKADRMSEYLNELNSLKEEFKGRIELFAGFEADTYGIPLPECDYIIGSCHHIKGKYGFYDVDHTAKKQLECAEREFSGDMYAYSAAYYEQFCENFAKMNADIVGHFDLVTKFNENNALFDESDKRYRKASLEALHTLAKYGKPFEINTGAISRGYRLSPYPAEFILKELKAIGGTVIINSDSHSAENVCAYFDDAVQFAVSCGFETAQRLTKNGFSEYSLK